MLPPNECRILLLVNGKFTLEDIRARVSAMSDKEFRTALEFLKNEGHVRQLANEGNAMDDPPTVVGVTELDTEHGVRAWAAATRAAEALNSKGYYLAREDQLPCSGPQQILVIDDEPAIGDVLAAVLGESGFEVESISDPRAALDKIKSMPCLVLVLLDVVMPHENGFDVLRRIRSQASLHKLAVVMLTGHADPKYVAEGLRDGADGYILKPFQPEKLVRYVQDTLLAK